MGEAIRIHVSAGRIVAQAVEHQLFVVVELDAEPVPAAELVMAFIEELVVHPGQAVEFELCPVPVEGSICAEASV